MKQRMLCVMLCICMLLAPALSARAAEGTMTAGGWNETLWAEIPRLRAADITAVSWTGTTAGSLEGQDFQYLVRDMEDGVRIDIPGLPAGTYTLTVATTSGTLTQSGIVVEAQDRSGYAHFGDTEGVGAYTNDGTLKENAIVLYVTEETKETVTVTSKDGTTVTGIGNILNSVGQDSGRGTTSKGGKANTNQDILRKLAADGTPLVVRIIGNVTAPAGLTAYNSVDYGGSVGDNGFMARMSGGKDITIEGIGTDACINGWGLHFVCQSSDYAKGWGRSFEVRNISFRNVPEDCVGMEGQQDGSVLTAPVERCWIHNCAFYAPKIANPAEDDKDGGDGACDFKRGQYFTNSYCYYEGYHKTNLVGGSDSNKQYHMTYHHNHWKNCESRAPLARQANIHMYNNIFENQSSYCMSIRANAYIFSEYNLFQNCKNPVQIKAGGMKSYGDSFQSCRGDNHAQVVSDKSTQVATDCQYANFDTDATLSYIPSGDYILQESISEMKEVVKAQAGPQKAASADSGSTGDSGETGGTGDAPAFPAGTYIQDFTASGMASQFYTISGNLSDSKGTVSYAGLTLTRCLKMESSTTISFTAPEDGTLLLVFGGNTDASGKTVKLDGVRQTIGENSILIVEILAGSHTVTKGDSINLYYMVYTSASVAGGEEPHTHSYEKVYTFISCAEGGYTTYTCACGDSYTEADGLIGHVYDVKEDLPTCGQDGSRNMVCVNCGETQSEVLPATGEHTYGEWISIENGRARTCSACGHTETEETGGTPTSTPGTTAAPSTSPATAGSTPADNQQEANGPGTTWIIAAIAAVILAAGACACIVIKKKK